MEYMFTKAELECLHSITEEVIEKSKKEKEYPYISSDEETKKQEEKVSQVTKCVQLLKYIISELNEQGIKPDIYKVLKMLYLADRAHLLKYDDLIAPDNYVKMVHGPVPNLCYSIIKFVRGDKYSFPFDESIKKEFEVVEDEKTGKRTKLHNLTKPDFDYLFNSNIECLDATIAKYGGYSFGKLKVLTHDEIYDSINDNDEITISDMLNVLNNDKEFAERCLQIFNKQ